MPRKQTYKNRDEVCFRTDQNLALIKKEENGKRREFKK